MKARLHTAAYSKRRRGFALIECLVYVAVLMLISSLALAAFYRAWDYSKHLRRVASDIERALEAGERWRADLRATRGTPQVTESKTETWLALPQTNGEIRYHFTNGTVFRRQSPAAGELPLLTGLKECRFLPDPRQKVTAWRWEIELMTTQRLVRVKPVFTFQAVSATSNNP